MTETENFEEDLFADLYDDNDTSAKGPPAPAPVAEPPDNDQQKSLPRPSNDANENEHMHHDGGEEEDDDEVDFNLGGGSNNAVAAPPQDTGSSTPPYGTVHKASAKDDG
ncbi:heterogeneous nuclear ribonucleoprotein HRP1 [Metarhizium album ARSEF 1941]|uniref:Heterogeneous nuclear ribonucleoprotein HRP1 n=1 Tax=Metarhizium album (strain ARSEF 1941) TaxID=1081103 RepID=A0A0B2WQS4_METAS|nr:heterogeneous nuclear ribonucleoprotein HRP1 [Metarhizium album ARSEF 1941]KHN96363.1 heterogeneous nuclear ribonucleoprotein HRP1 [Metarhizium album ARSEF 1941]